MPKENEEIKFQGLDFEWANIKYYIYVIMFQPYSVGCLEQRQRWTTFKTFIQN